MKRGNQKKMYAAAWLLAAFILWTLLVRFVDEDAIGPQGTTVGFAALNGLVHEITGACMPLYTVTDWFGLIPIGVAFGFAILGFIQWMKRRSLLKVDRSLLLLGGFYATVMLVYTFFELVIVNYRPVLIDGALEASYPSSTTMLVTCVMSTAMMQWNLRIKNKVIKRTVLLLSFAFIAFMVIGRLLSGVHWITDIIGGGLISAGLVMLYAWSLER